MTKKPAPSAKTLARLIAQRQAEQRAREANPNPQRPFTLHQPFRAAKVVRRSGCCK